MYGVCLAVAFLLSPIENQQFGYAQTCKADLLICNGIPVPTGKWYAVYSPRKKGELTYISVYKYDVFGHTYLGMAATQQEAISMLREGIVLRKRLPRDY